MTYRKPAKIKGGISFIPNLIIGQEDDHKIVTKKARNTEKKCLLARFENLLIH